MMETNFWGTLNMMKAFYPIINENGRIVNVSGFVSVKAMNKMQLLSRQGKELHSINQSLEVSHREENFLFVVFTMTNSFEKGK